MLQVDRHDAPSRQWSDSQASAESSHLKEDRPALLAALSANATLVAWLVFLGFGGSLLTLYYVQIRYFPDLEWKDSLAYLAAMSVLGGGIVNVYALLLFFPGVIWSEFLIFDRDLCTEFCSAVPEGGFANPEEPCFWQTWRRLGIPFTIFMIIVHAGMPWKASGLVIATISGLIALTGYSLLDFRTLRRHLSLEKDKARSLRVKYITAVNAAALSSFASLLFIEWLVKASATLQLLVACTATVVISNFLVAVQFRNKPGRAVIVGIIAALVLLCSGEYLDGGKQALSLRIMSGFGLGSESTVTLVVTDAGVEILDAYELPPSVFSHAGSAALSQGSTPVEPNASRERALRGARILSRLGSEYLIEVNGRRMTLPKNVVRSWYDDLPATKAAAMSR